MNQSTTLGELFKLWIVAKAVEDGIKEQTVGQYRQVWIKHGVDQLGALRVTDLPTSRANAHIQAVADGCTVTGRVSADHPAGHVRDGSAVRRARGEPDRGDQDREGDRGSRPGRVTAVRSSTAVRSAVTTYTTRRGIGGPKPGRLLLEFVEVLDGDRGPSERSAGAALGGR